MKTPEKWGKIHFIEVTTQNFKHEFSYDLFTGYQKVPETPVTRSQPYTKCVLNNCKRNLGNNFELN